MKEHVGGLDQARPCLHRHQLEEEEEVICSKESLCFIFHFLVFVPLSSLSL